jgi:AcrR family transcriptional regulator
MSPIKKTTPQKTQTMKDKKIDRRINRTRKLLRAALLELILEKGFEMVTVEDITDRADLGRTTFYLHYKDKEDLLFENINEMIDDLFVQISDLPLSVWNFPTDDGRDENLIPTPILLIFQHAAEHADLYRIILRGAGTSEATARLREIISNAVSEFIELKRETGESLHLNMRVPLDFFANYFTGSLLGIVNWWLETGAPYTPEEMASMYRQLFFLGAFQVFNHPDEAAGKA